MYSCCSSGVMSFSCRTEVKPEMDTSGARMSWLITASRRLFESLEFSASCFASCSFWSCAPDAAAAEEDDDRTDGPEQDVAGGHICDLSSGDCAVRLHGDGNADAAADVTDFIALLGVTLETGLPGQQRTHVTKVFLAVYYFQRTVFVIGIGKMSVMLCVPSCRGRFRGGWVSGW